MLPVQSSIVAVAAFIENINKELIVIDSPLRDWEVPGGHVEKGENLIDALKREVFEEAGIFIQCEQLIGVYSNLGSPNKVIFDFKAEYVGGALTTSKESTDVKWVNKTEAMKLIVHPGYRMRLGNYLNECGKIAYVSYTHNPFTIHYSTYI